MRKAAAALALLLFLAHGAQAEVSLPALVADHMVLQRSPHTRVWGKAAPGETVKVSLDAAASTATAGPDGRWSAELDLASEGEGPFDLVVEGRNRIVVSDVLVGEVWICSGQSNMAFTMAMNPANRDAVAASSDPRVRQFAVAPAAADRPRDDCQGKWAGAGPDTTGAFTAVGYFFAKALEESLHEPVGLIRAAWGGTRIEAWLSRDGYAGSPETQAILDRLLAREAAYPAAKAAYVRAFGEWAGRFGRGDRPVNPAPFLAPGGDGWKPVAIPGSLGDAGLPDAGAVWLRRSVSLPAVPPGKTVEIDLGAPRGFEAVYWDGAKIGETTPETDPGNGGRRRYAVPAALAGQGAHALAVRLFSPACQAGFGGYLVEALPYPLTSPLLDGTWEGKAESELPPLTAEGRRALPPRVEAPARPQDVASALYDGMIAPLLFSTFRGVLWYQGESNTARAFSYRLLFPALVGDWRSRAGTGFPFYFCQLPAFGPKAPAPGESLWAELRESQAAALSLPDTGMAVLIDTGEEADIHPKDKRTPGERLAHVALAETYARATPHSGPVFDSLRTEGSAIRVRFRGASEGLAAKPLPDVSLVSSVPPVTRPLILPSPGGAVQGFAVCGIDRKWAWADARIEGDAVVVSSPAVAAPVAVRYAWADNPTCNLSDGTGLPASPFRTDDFPALSRGAGN